MFKPFAVEQYLSETEHGVRFNFSESGVHPMSYSELFEFAGVDQEKLFASLVDYPQVNGTEALRRRIAALYADAVPENVLVTVGATEANTLVASTLLDAGDNMVTFRPTYEQLPGNVENLGFEVRSVDLVADSGWAVDLDALAGAIDARTRVIHVVNPHNPTGQVLSDKERKAIVDLARKHDLWLVADEVYVGTERNSDTPTESFWGSYDRVIAINSMSKAYGLPGLRLGWLLAPRELLPEFWRRHEYATIAASALSMQLASAALTASARDAITGRARRLIRRGFDTLRECLAEHPGVFSVVEPQASAMSFVKFHLPLSSEAFAARLLNEEGVLVIPGSRFGIESHFRFSSALPDDYLREGLGRMNGLVGRILA